LLNDSRTSRKGKREEQFVVGDKIKVQESQKREGEKTKHVG